MIPLYHFFAPLLRLYHRYLPALLNTGVGVSGDV
jgi:hypothetical protein